ncbi:MAG: hypothetical protein ABIW57_09350, partial [Polyangia bacterium]
ATPPPIPIGFPAPRSTPGAGPVIGAAPQGATPPPISAPVSVGGAAPPLPKQGQGHGARENGREGEVREGEGEGGDLTPPPGRAASPLPLPPVVAVGAKTPPLGTIISHKRS